MEEINAANAIKLRIKEIWKDPKEGLGKKFQVNRVDWKDRPGEKHYLCEYFVLDLMHDRHAIQTLRAYAYSVMDENPKLAYDLSEVARIMEEEMSKVEKSKD